MMMLSFALLSLAMAPTLSQAAALRAGGVRDLATMDYAGNNGHPSSAFPLGLCEADCDTDSDCAGSLVCFQRVDEERVPGCAGHRGDYDGNDFCIDSSNGNDANIQLVGDNGRPSSAFPLGLCQGDCDSDSDCGYNLVCFQRHDEEAVPGCTGRDQHDGKDFCIEKFGPSRGNTKNKMIDLAGNNGGAAFPLARCEGDCDNDQECADGLVCFQRDGTTEVPGCQGSYRFSGMDFCIAPIVSVGNNGVPRSAFPLGLCEGDCDSDSECGDGLICFQRGGKENVPGCAYSDSLSGQDFCVYD